MAAHLPRETKRLKTPENRVRGLSSPLLFCLCGIGHPYSFIVQGITLIIHSDSCVLHTHINTERSKQTTEATHQATNNNTSHNNDLNVFFLLARTNKSQNNEAHGILTLSTTPAMSPQLEEPLLGSGRNKEDEKKENVTLVSPRI